MTHQNNPSPKKNEGEAPSTSLLGNLNKQDIFFSLVITILLTLSIVSIKDISRRPAEMVASSFLFGLTGAIATQWWFKNSDVRNDNLEIKLPLLVARLTGGTATLAGIGLLTYLGIERSIDNSSILTDPREINELSVLNDHAEPVHLKINQGGDNYLEITQNPDNLKEILDLCRENKGFCETTPKVLNAEAKDDLKEEFVLVCNEDLDKLYVYIFRDSTQSPAEEALAFVDPRYCQTANSQDYIWLSQSIYQKLGLSSSNNQVKVYIQPQRKNNLNVGQVYR